MAKIKTLIINDNEKAINKIKECLEPIEYVEIVGECKKGKDAFDKIIELKPDTVFLKYKMKDYDAMDIMVRTSEILREKTPIIKFVSDDVSKNTEGSTVYKEKSNKKNIECINNIKELGKEEIIKVLEEYYQNMII